MEGEYGRMKMIATSNVSACLIRQRLERMQQIMSMIHAVGNEIVNHSHG